MKKPVSERAKAFLRIMTTDELAWLVSKQGSKDFDHIKSIAQKIWDYNTNTVMRLESSSPRLPVDHAYAKGSRSIMMFMVDLIDASKEEIARRKKTNKGVAKTHGSF